MLSLSRQDGPVSVGLIVDASRSMQKGIGFSLAAIERLLKTQRAGDEWFVLRFGDRPVMMTRFTEDPNEIAGALSSIQCHGWTALNDAIYLGVSQIKRARNARRALIVLTDGADNRSRYSDSEVRNLVRESDVRVYSIGLFERVDLLDKLAKESGGRALWARKPADLPEIIETLSTVLRNQYVLGYVPKNHSKDGRYRQVLVRLKATTGRAKLRVSWRRGYYSD